MVIMEGWDIDLGYQMVTCLMTSRRHVTLKGQGCHIHLDTNILKTVISTG